jgi:aspartate racemase
MPLLHIGDPVGRAAGDAGVRRVGLLGTRFTMEDAFLKDYLVQHFGLEVVTPDQAGRDHIHRIIFEELCLGRVTDEGRAAMRRLMDGLQADGAQAVILGCTELPMLVDESAAGLTVLDTTRLHAHAAVDRALADEPGP